MCTPLAKLDLLVGYGLAFALVAVVQAGISSAVGFGLLGLESESAIWIVVGIAVANAVLGMAFGLFLSAFARTEFQAVQFMPAFVLPQILLAGLIVPREDMARALELVSDVLPLTYAYEALARAVAGDLDARLAFDLAVVSACIVLALALGATTLRRRTP
jgi:ABC-2 type transport system permease protein